MFLQMIVFVLFTCFKLELCNFNSNAELCFKKQAFRNPLRLIDPFVRNMRI